MRLKLAEYFHSIQGEGPEIGMPMTFIRLPGCLVGRYKEKGSHYAECETVLGERFICDTNYHAHEEVEITKVVKESPSKHFCLTGGEPFSHPRVYELIRLLDGPLHHRLSIETSGTVPISAAQISAGTTIVVSPKRGFDWRNLEGLTCKLAIKLVVGQQTDLDKLREFIEAAKEYVFDTDIFLQPVNGVKSINGDNMELVSTLCIEHNLRVSPQLHKIMGVR